MAGGNSLNTSAADIEEQVAKLSIDLKWTEAQVDLFNKATAILVEVCGGCKSITHCTPRSRHTCSYGIKRLLYEELKYSCMALA
jgi:hypothetical protein